MGISLLYSADVLLPITRGVFGKHQWCSVLNTLQYVSLYGSNLLSEKSCTTQSKQTLFDREGLLFQRQHDIIYLKEIPHGSAYYLSFIGQ